MILNVCFVCVCVFGQQKRAIGFVGLKDFGSDLKEKSSLLPERSVRPVNATGRTISIKTSQMISTMIHRMISKKPDKMQSHLLLANFEMIRQNTHI